MSFGVMLILPLIVFAVCSVRPVLALAWYHFSPLKFAASTARSPRSPRPTPTSPRAARIQAPSKHRFGFMVESTHDIDDLFDAMLEVCLPFLSIMYIGLVKTSLFPFFCKPVVDGTTLLAIAPAITCWDNNEHYALVAVGVVAIVLYVIGIPLSIFTVLLHGVRHDCLSDPRWLNVLGYYYKKYKTEYWYWELVILLRRFSFSFVSVTLQKEAYVQCGIGCVLCLSAMLAQFTCRPFIEDGLNSLDCLCTFSVLLTTRCRNGTARFMRGLLWSSTLLRSRFVAIWLFRSQGNDIWLTRSLAR